MILPLRLHIFECHFYKCYCRKRVTQTHTQLAQRVFVHRPNDPIPVFDGLCLLSLAAKKQHLFDSFC